MKRIAIWVGIIVVCGFVVLNAIGGILYGTAWDAFRAGGGSVTFPEHKDAELLRVAATRFQTAGRFRFYDSKPTVFRAMALLDLEEYDAAIDCLTGSLKRPGMKVDELVLMAFAFKQKGEFETMVAWLRRADEKTNRIGDTISLEYYFGDIRKDPMMAEFKHQFDG